jgi:hypothetical protein
MSIYETRQQKETETVYDVSRPRNRHLNRSFDRFMQFSVFNYVRTKSDLSDDITLNQEISSAKRRIFA